MKRSLRSYASFAADACDRRKATADIPPEWLTVCQLKSTKITYYAPRWTWPILYFRGKTSQYFRGTKGLDVGARINHLAGPHKGLAAVAKYSRTAETLVPHFEYYSLLGGDMAAVDINAPDPKYKEIQYGDVRLLSFASRSFQFVTMPMILGPFNPCATYLEVALSLCELRRVLQPGGFVYVAEVGFQPSVSFTAYCLEFDVYVSKGSLDGLPIGTLFRKPPSQDQPSVFNEIFTAPAIHPVVFDQSLSEVFRNCHLLRDEAPISAAIVPEDEPLHVSSGAVF